MVSKYQPMLIYFEYFQILMNVKNLMSPVIYTLVSTHLDLMFVCVSQDMKIQMEISPNVFVCILLTISHLSW